VTLAQQQPRVIRRFWDRSLGERLARERVSIEAADNIALAQVIQLVGAAQLIGWQIPRGLFARLPLDRIGRAPCEALPHRSGAEQVEPYQWQLWLGLRVVAALADARVLVDAEVLARTLELWRRNLAESASRVHRAIDVSMIRWLEACLTSKTGALIPSREPLWLLIGFAADPATLSVSLGDLIHRKLDRP
jgi:hypothetical protein